MESVVISTISALVGITIGAIVSYFIAKKQITANVAAANRQAWINTLRDCISELQASVAQLGADTLMIPKDRMEKLSKATQVYNKIQLLINPREEDHNKLVAYFTRLLRYVTTTELAEKEVNKIGQLQRSVTSISQIILKKEWERVKKGI